MAAIVLVKVKEEVLIKAAVGQGVMSFPSPEDGVAWIEKNNDYLHNRRMTEQEAMNVIELQGNTRVIEVENPMESVRELSGQVYPVTSTVPVFGVKVLPEYHYLFEEGLQPRLTLGSFH